MRFNDSEVDFAYGYDVLKRLDERSYTMPGGFTISSEYTYQTIQTLATTRVETYTSTVNDGTALTYRFTYDQNGNVTKIVFSTGEEIRYVYDDLGQLLREDNGLLGATYVYTYDNAGNILSKNKYSLTAEGTAPSNPTKTDTFAYGNSGWGDLLTSYNGHEITYDEIGNPLDYYNVSSYTFSWTGKELTGLVKGGQSYSFTYNDAGIRTTKTRNGITTTYYLSGSQIVAEETNGNVTVYIYDAEGLPLGMQYHGASYAEDAWDVFWYEKNIFGDVVAVYDESGTKLISYKYDAYGNWRSLPHNGGYSTAAFNNPFRYRGYYYDFDLGLYYLNSRYYDAYTGRFISADNALYHSMLGYNMYVYCNNNPINFVDHSGESAEAIATFFGWMWTAALVEPTPAGEIVASVITAFGIVGAVVAIGLGIVEVGELIDGTSQANKKEDVLVAPPQSITESNEETESSTPTINEAKDSKAKDTKEGSKYKGKKVAPRIKSNNKKTARQKAFLKGGKRSPIHHPNGKFGPHFHPNNPKFSHWHYYYIIVFTVGRLEEEG